MENSNETFVVPAVVSLAAISTANGKHWAEQHNNAVLSPKDMENPIIFLFEYIQSYCRKYAAVNDSLVGDDYVIGSDGIGPMLKAWFVLLNGETGRLDCGTLDSAGRKLAKLHNLTCIEQ